MTSSPEVTPGHDDEGHAHLTEPLIWDADHRCLQHGGMAQQRVLDLCRVGIEASDDEHVLDAADDAQPARCVQLSEVPGAKPAVRRQHLARLLGVVEVPRHDAAAAEQHLAGLPGLDFVAVVGDEPQFEARPRPAHRGGDSLGIVVFGRGARGARLGESVAGDDVREGELVSDATDELHGDVGRAGDGNAQGREVVVAACGWSRIDW